MAEDPYPCSSLGVEMTKREQEHFRVAATAKHFAVYSNSNGAREEKRERSTSHPAR